MKRCFFICLALFASNMQGFAQKFLNVYQDNVVIKQISTTEIDSISVTETEPHIISMWSNGNVSLTYTSEEIDSITVSNQSGYPFSYIGIIGFNDQLYMKDIGILSKATADNYKSFVNDLSRKNGTMLYYAVDNALDMLDKANIKTPLKNVALITFTDGLDQGSLMMTDKYETSKEYLEAMSKRITSTTVNGIPVNAYSVGLCGNDVTNVSLFSQNLRYLASSEENCYELSNISGLSERLKAIANQIINVSKRQTISIKIPGVDSGTRERITFDGKPAESSQLYIEGTFNRKDLSLHDVTYHGLKATSGTMVQGTQNGIFVTYTFMGLRLETGSGLIPTSNIQHYYMLPSTSSWQKNTEFGSSKDTQTSVSHSGATIFLILDCSSSLGSDFSKMQQYSNEFINMIANNAEPFSIAAPRNVIASLDDDEMVVNVRWNGVKYAEYYSVYRTNSIYGSLFAKKIVDSLTVTSWRDESPQTGYNGYLVHAMGHGLTSAESNLYSVNCEIAAPTNVTASKDEEEWGVNVNWDAVKYAEYYSVYRSSNSSSEFTKVADSLTVTSWHDDSPRNTNYYRVCAEGHGVISKPSNSALVKCDIPAPKNVTAKMDDNEWKINVSWDAVKHAKYYKVYRNDSSGYGFTKVADSLTVTSWCDESPLNGNNYYEVYSNLSSIEYGKSEVVKCEIAAPTNVTATLDYNEMVANVNWNAVKYAEYYSVYRSSNSSSGFTKVADSLTVTSWRDNNPLNGWSYYRIYSMGHGIMSPHAQTSFVIEKLYCPDYHHPHIIDLGLPSGTKWSCCNIHMGNPSPTNKGGEYAWGETETKDEYSLNAYKYYENGSTMFIGYDIAGTQYDVAHVRWGGPWVIPSVDQMNELYDNCTYKWTNENGVNGYKFTSKKNNTSIFLPSYGDQFGSYWSSSQGTFWERAYSISFDTFSIYINSQHKHYGKMVRPVSR